MIHQEPTGAFRAGFFLAVGAALGIVGLLLSAGRSVAGEVVSEHAPRTVQTFLVWGPRSLIVAGAALAIVSGLVLWVEWSQRKT